MPKDSTLWPGEDFPGMQGCFKIQASVNTFHHVNRVKKENHASVLTRVEKAFDKIQSIHD